MQKRFRYGDKSRRSRFNKPTKNIKQDKIHHSKFINKAITRLENTPYSPEHTFHDFGLNSALVARLDYINFVSPSEIQDKTIPDTLSGKDIIGLANTGTGKTAAFLLPTINKLINDNKICSVIILAPTRELAQQIETEFIRFSAGSKLYSVLVVGGMNIGRQIKAVSRGPHVVIGTPGRVKDLINRKVLRLSGINTLILDEADRMCDMGFEKDIRFIEAEIPKNRQTLCYSATMTPSVKKIVEEFMIDPITVSVIKEQTNSHIEQDVIFVDDHQQKSEKLTELLSRPDFEKVIIFGETKYGVQRLSDSLNKNGLSSEAIHGNKSQSQRDRALKNFKNHSVNVLVATDVAARGLDIPNVSHVINYDIPKTYDDYVHRIGRTGRAGKAGTALTFIKK